MRHSMWWSSGEAASINKKKKKEILLYCYNCYKAIWQKQHSSYRACFCSTVDGFHQHLFLICDTGFSCFTSVIIRVQSNYLGLICVNALFNCVYVLMCCRRMITSSCTMKTQRSRVTTSWTNGFSPSHSPSSSSSRLRWMVRQINIFKSIVSWNLITLLLYSV